MIVDGAALAAAILKEVAAEIQKCGTPKLCIISLGDHEPSKVYVRNKLRACAAAGIEAELVTRADSLPALLSQLNGDPSVHGILVQLPLPEGDARSVATLINPEKDVDGLHPRNLGLLSMGIETIVPCTPRAVIHILEKHTDIGGKRAVVIGRGLLVGRPLAAMLLNRDATVTVCHSKTKDLAAHTREADIVIAAAGVPGLVTGDMVKAGAAVIDVGITVTGTVTGKAIRGDVHFDSVSKKASLITPVPGGVGPMTVAMLLLNTLEAFKRQQ